MRIIGSDISRWILLVLGLAIDGVADAAAASTLPYTASFQVPDLQLNKTSYVNYQIKLGSPETTVPNLSIVLCQSNSALLDTDGTNSWQVLNVLPDFCMTTSSVDETCRNHPFKGKESLQLNLIKDPTFNSTGLDTLNNFFFCSSHLDTTTSTVCDYSSAYFNISPPVAGAKPADPSELDTSTALFTSSPSQITISTTKAILLLSPTPTPTLSSSTPTTADGISPKKKGISTGVKIGIAFGILSLFLIFGFTALFLLRRSRLKKNAQASRSHNIDEFSENNLHAEKNDCCSPPTPSGWGSSQTRTLIQDQAPAQELEDKNYHGQLAPSGSVLPGASSKNPDTRDDSTQKPTRPRRSLSIVSRESARSVSISSIPSPLSSGFETFKDGIEGQSRMGMAMSRGMGSTAPFLREEGMSPEEMAKLEDEERRIDAAIAEAEAERARGRR